MVKRWVSTFLSLFLCTSVYAQPASNKPYLLITDATHSVYAWKAIFPTNTVTDSGGGVATVSTGSGGGGSGDVTDVGDCATGACFTGSSGNTLTFKGGTSGTTALKPTAVAGTTTITMPAETGTMCTTGSVCSGYQASGSYLTAVTSDAPLSGSGTAGSHLVISTAGTWSGNAGTATALAANGANCSAGSYPLGVDASGATESCTVAASAAADYITGSAQSTLSAEQSLGALTTGLLLNTSAAGTGTLSQYAGTSCTNQFPRSLSASGAATCASVASTDIAAMTSSALAGIISDETGSGALVFGTSPTFTTSVVMPNGANPTVDAAGKLAVDTSATTGSMLKFYGDASYQLPGYFSKTIMITSTTSASDAAVWRTPWAITIKAVHVLATGGTNVVGQLANCDTNGANCAAVDSSDITATTGTIANDDGSLSSPAIAAGNFVGWLTTSVSGTNTRTAITFEYTVDAVN